MASDDQTLDPCGCCEGITQLTPQPLTNLPGLSTVAYRVGTHGSFKTTMLADLSGPGGLAALTTRRDDDPSVALLDACATMLDVLTFYQERIANEGYLRTATERLSVLALARAIGYELNPGVAASTFLAFEMETAPSAPTSALIPVGTKVQSLPGQDEQPQVFETIEPIEARVVWNRLKPQTFQYQLPKFGDTELYLQGAATNIKPGDALLLIGDERQNDPGNENWDLRRAQAVRTVTPVSGPSYTVVTLDRALGALTPHKEPAQQHPQVYALRLRANLFGHNAPDWHTLPVSLRIGEISPQKDAQGNAVFIPGIYANRQNSWADAQLATGTKRIHLDAVYSAITKASWVVLSAPDWVEVFQVQAISEETQSDYNLTLKTTRLEISGEQTEKFSPRTTSVYAQSEAIALAAQPITDPLQGATLVLDQLLPGLAPEQTLIVTGKRMR
ncbi:MAG: putative baseplate assembly protein, partial [Chloroflexi bacterium]|nr:putative baseplate assembly protein [Chloroflexota bacterium]